MSYISVKSCYVCKIEKPFGDFAKNRASKDGLQYSCKSCQIQYRKDNRERERERSRLWHKNNPEGRLNWQKNNPDACRKATKKSYEKHRERRLIAARKYANENKEAVLSSQSMWREKNRERERERSKQYSKENPDKVRAQAARRRARRLSGTPKWANKFIIDEIYDLAQKRQVATGVKHHVDHIVPLSSDYVCGLHCEQNLQILTAADNLIKSNRLESIA